MKRIYWPHKGMRVGVIAVVAAGLMWVGVGCSDDDEENPMAPTMTTGSVVFNFDHTVDGAAFTTTTSGYPYTNAAGNQYRVEELSYYVSDFRVYKSDGTSYGVDAVHYRDAEDATTRGFTFAGVPAGTYTAVSFTFGLDAQKNQSGALLPDYNFIVWPPAWGGGYHYMEMNGFYDQGGTNTPSRTHTGRRFVSTTDGTPPGPDNVAYHHFFEVYAEITPFQVAGGDTWAVSAVMNVNGWYEDPVFDFTTYFVDANSNIMVNLPAQYLLLQNGMTNVYTITDAVKQ